MYQEIGDHGSLWGKISCDQGRKESLGVFFPLQWIQKEKSNNNQTKLTPESLKRQPEIICQSRTAVWETTWHLQFPNPCLVSCFTKLISTVSIPCPSVLRSVSLCSFLPRPPPLLWSGWICSTAKKSWFGLPLWHPEVKPSRDCCQSEKQLGRSDAPKTST